MSVWTNIRGTRTLYIDFGFHKKCRRLLFKCLKLRMDAMNICFGIKKFKVR